ncbi:MAG: RNA polymerase sigma factor SigA [Candidatus Latescibacteria bacterium ADurb.Bin168]|nr:MAG: RNA polymerase sigma factor SigA [Candidatus Latescibacteria bacterium ADurb.Bin168]
MTTNAAGGSKLDDQALEAYLREVRDYVLLTREEEVQLARQIKRGDQKALEKLTSSNLRFVISVAKKYQNRGMSLLDLISEGNVGLMEAAYRFDETKGFKFISYAVWWIKQAILKALSEQSRIVRVPLNRVGDAQKVDKRVSALCQYYGREPTIEEIASSAEMSPEDVEKALDISRPHLSLDDPGHQEGGRTLLDTIPLEDEAFQESPFERRFGIGVEETLSELDEREAEIIRRYFGLDNQDPESLKDIGASFGITRERARQLKERALAQLRKTHKKVNMESRRAV